MFQPSASITETTASAPIAATKALKAAKRKGAKPVQHFGLLPTKFEGPDNYNARRREALATLRLFVENRRLTHAGHMSRATRYIRSLNLTMRDLYELAASLHSEHRGYHPSSDQVVREAAHLGYQASLLLASRVTPKDWREAYHRLDFVSRSFGALPMAAREGALRRMIRDLKAMIEGDGKVLPNPANTHATVPHDGRVEVPPYYLGKCFKREDELLLSCEAFRGYVPSRS